MHIGSYDSEPDIALMDVYVEENEYQNDYSETRRHHEFYLSNPEGVASEKM